MEALGAQPRYPVRVEIDYPERQIRWKALLRLPLSIPILIFANLLQSGVALAIWAAILVRGRIPRWLFDFQVALNRWQVRAISYFALLTDEYPPFEGEYPVRYEVEYPERPSRWRLVIWKFITSVPHFFVLAILSLTLVVVVPIAWVAILLTGRFPKGLHGYVTGILRWAARVQAYVLSLTDEFPPFSLGQDAGSGGTAAYVSSSVIGVLAVSALIAGFAAFVTFAGEKVVTEVSYERLLAGQVRAVETRAAVGSGVVELVGAVDPADELFPVLQAKPDYRLVQFDLAIEITRSGDDVELKQGQFSLKDANGDRRDSVLAVVGGRVTPVTLKKHDVAEIVLVFELPRGVAPAELRYDVVNYIDGPRVGETIVYEFR